MAATSICAPCCVTPLSVNVPGVPGVDGVDGTNGVNAFTLTTADYTIPAVGATLTVNVGNSTWMVVGEEVIVQIGAGTFAHFQVTALPSAVQATLMFLGEPGDQPPTTAFLTGAKISPSGVRGGGATYFVQTGVDLLATAFMDTIEVVVTGKTVTLPSASGIKGKIYRIKMGVLGSATIATTGGETIDDVATKTLVGQYDFIVVQSDGVNWVMIGTDTSRRITTTAVDLAASIHMDVILITVFGKTVTLPTPVGIAGKVFTVKLTGAGGTATVATAAGSIDGGPTFGLSAQYKQGSFLSDGANYWIISGV